MATWCSSNLSKSILSCEIVLLFVQSMFTGLIEHIGGISSIVINEGGCTLSIGGAAPILDDCHIGDSIAVNGVCLTVTSFNRQKEGGWFQVWLANETLQRTGLGTVGALSRCSRLTGPQGRAGLGTT